MDEFNAGIVGYRNFTDFDLFEEKVLYVLGGKDNLDIVDNIVSGGCKGTDTLAEMIAKKYHLKTLIHHPKREGAYSRSMYLDRNHLIVRDSVLLIAFVSPTSKGTYHTIGLAKKKGIPVHIFDIS